MTGKHNPTTTELFSKLTEFRQAAYLSLGTAKDALFDLSDAVISCEDCVEFNSLQ